MINDPGFEQGIGFQHGVNKKEATVEHERSPTILCKLVLWEDINNEKVLEEASEGIRKN